MVEYGPVIKFVPLGNFLLIWGRSHAGEGIKIEIHDWYPQSLSREHITKNREFLQEPMTFKPVVDRLAEELSLLF